MATQIDIARKAGISQPYLCEIIGGKKTPRWEIATRLGEATRTSPVLWVDGQPEARRLAVSNADDISKGETASA